VDVLLRQNLGSRFFGWIAYTWSKSERLNPGGDWSLYEYDQTHIGNLVGFYRITPKWGFGAKLHYNSGPLYQTFQYRYQATSVSGTPLVDSQGNPVYRGVFSDSFNQRLEDYLRLDLRTDYAFRFAGWSLNAYIEYLNVLGRNNPQGIQYDRDYSASHVVNNLPGFPYFGLQAEY